jgi:hypothetical protein
MTTASAYDSGNSYNVTLSESDAKATATAGLWTAVGNTSTQDVTYQKFSFERDADLIFGLIEAQLTTGSPYDHRPSSPTPYQSYSIHIGQDTGSYQAELWKNGEDLSTTWYPLNSGTNTGEISISGTTVTFKINDSVVSTTTLGTVSTFYVSSSINASGEYVKLESGSAPTGSGTLLPPPVAWI